MSIDEQIAVLESEKRAYVERYDQQIQALSMKKQHSHDNAPADQRDEVVLPSGRRLIQSSGRTLSQVIIEDRGSY